MSTVDPPVPGDRRRDAPEMHLAQLNVARLLAPLDTPQLAGFVAALDPINALADWIPNRWNMTSTR